MTRSLSREELLHMLIVMKHPKRNGLTQERLEEMLIDFSANCPDPVEAWRLVAECLDPMTDEQLVDRALAMPFRSMADVPTSIVPADHPLRRTS